MTRIESNIDEVIQWYVRHAPRREYVLKIINESPWARYLQARAGYWVVNDAAAQNIVYAELSKAIDEAAQAGEMLDHRRVVKALDAARERIVDYYQQVIGAKDTRGAVKPPPRPMHRGSWADDTETTAKSFVSYINEQYEKRHAY